MNTILYLIALFNQFVVDTHLFWFIALVVFCFPLVPACVLVSLAVLPPLIL